MTTKTYIALAAVAVIIGILIGSTLWSDHKLSKLERELEESKHSAEVAEQRSRELEQTAAEYKRKIEYLEGSLSDTERTAEQQDEEIKSRKNDTDISRRDADRARRTKRVESTGAELCRKLDDLGHPCE